MLYAQIFRNALCDSEQWYFEENEKFQVIEDGKGNTYILWKDEAIDFDDLLYNVVLNDFYQYMYERGGDPDTMDPDEVNEIFRCFVDDDESLWVYLDIEYRWIKEQRENTWINQQRG